MTDTPKPAPATPAATPMAALNQRGWDLLRQMRHKLFEEKLISEDEYTYLLAEVKGSVKRLEDYDRAVAALQPAAAQPQRESEQLEQVAKLTDKILTELFKQYSGKEFKSFRHALRRTLEPIMRAALAPQTDSQEPR